MLGSFRSDMVSIDEGAECYGSGYPGISDTQETMPAALPMGSRCVNIDNRIVYPADMFITQKVQVAAKPVPGERRRITFADAIARSGDVNLMPDNRKQWNSPPKRKWDNMARPDNEKEAEISVVSCDYVWGVNEKRGDSISRLIAAFISCDEDMGYYLCTLEDRNRMTSAVALNPPSTGQTRYYSLYDLMIATRPYSTCSGMRSFMPADMTCEEITTVMDNFAVTSSFLPRSSWILVDGKLVSSHRELAIPGFTSMTPYTYLDTYSRLNSPLTPNIIKSLPTQYTKLCTGERIIDGEHFYVHELFCITPMIQYNHTDIFVSNHPGLMALGNLQKLGNQMSTSLIRIVGTAQIMGRSTLPIGLFRQVRYMSMTNVPLPKILDVPVSDIMDLRILRYVCRYCNRKLTRRLDTAFYLPLVLNKGIGEWRLSGKLRPLLHKLCNKPTLVRYWSNLWRDDRTEFYANLCVEAEIVSI